MRTNSLRISAVTQIFAPFARLTISGMSTTAPARAPSWKASSQLVLPDPRLVFGVDRTECDRVYHVFWLEQAAGDASMTAGLNHQCHPRTFVMHDQLANPEHFEFVNQERKRGLEPATSQTPVVHPHPLPNYERALSSPTSHHSTFLAWRFIHSPSYRRNSDNSSGASLCQRTPKRSVS